MNIIYKDYLVVLIRKSSEQLKNVHAKLIFKSKLLSDKY